MRLLSYNIHKGVGGRDRRYRLARIIDVIEQENPDLICLQEVVRNTRRDNQPRLLADYFHGQAWQFQMNVRYKVGGYGNLILSRWPMLIHHHVSLQMKQKKPRGAQLAVIDTPEGPLHLVNWHLGLAERERLWQVEHLLSHRLFRESESFPTLITGDFNDWRNALDKSIFQAHGLEHITHPMSRFRTFPAWLPVGSLDKAYFRGDLTIRHAHVVHSKLAKQASDHLPLVIDFHLGTGGE